MNRQQIKYLQDRLSEVLRRKRTAAIRKVGVPVEVANARRIIAKWEEQESKIVGQIRERISQEYSKASQAIMFQEPGDALKAVREFERFQP